MMQDYEQELAAIRDLLKNNPGGMSVTDISKALQKNKNTVGRYLDILLISGQVDMRAFGMAKVYTLSQRVPLSAMLSYSSELIMVLDSDLRITDINDNFATLLQLAREEIVGKSASLLHPPEADIHELLDAITTNPRGLESDVTFHLKGTGDRIFHQKCIPTVFDDGRKGSTLILEDITERILAEKAIRKSEERFRMMADNIQDGLIIAENGKTIYAINRIAEITGYPLEEFSTLEPLAFIAPESHEDAICQIRDLESSPEKPCRLQTWIIRKNKERRFVFARISGVRHHDTVYNFIIFTDLTDLKAQEARLRESEERFRMMADNIQDGLIIVENDNIVFSNRRIKEISGYSMDELADRGLNGTLLRDDLRSTAGIDSLPETQKEEIEKIFRTVRPDSPHPGEFKMWISRKDGEPRYIHGKITAAQHGDVTSFYVTIADITDFAEREKALRERIDALQDLIH
jgi:PAS domain S-box-containing protein